MTIASGTLLAALAVAGAAVGHAAPNDEQAPAPVNTGDLTAATAPATTDGPESAAESLLPPKVHAPAPTAEDPNSPPGAAPAANDDPGAAAAPAPALGGLGGLGSLGSMGSSIGSSMAMMGPMYAAYIPVMGAPMLANQLPGMVEKAVQEHEAGLSSSGSAAAVDPNLPATLGLVPGDIPNPDADPASLAEAAPAAASVLDAGSAAATPAFDGGFVPDVTALTEALGDVGDHVNLGLDTGGMATCGALTAFGWC
ncbi:hypothetical protein [Mycolicibacter acidiphilus]|nr:hypothetical protein [Mycolicibacter acidiphilus]